MKTLKVTDYFQSKLDQLLEPAGKLTYSGEDLAAYTGKPVVAIVGTRKPTPYGKKVTEEIAADLARAGVVVISGNALGVDVAAQNSAIDAGGKVISVLQSGLDSIYPATNRKDAERLLQSGGTLITEFEPGHTPHKHDFLHRNRLIAALADAVVVTEAALRSGSLNTARHASAMGIPVFAVPGNVTSSPTSGGTNLLLASDEALAVLSARDVLKKLQITPTPKPQPSTKPPGYTEDEVAVLKELSAATSDIETISEQTGLCTPAVQATLSSLEVQGAITQDSLGNWHIS